MSTDLIAIARECGALSAGITSGGDTLLRITASDLTAFAARIKAEERERCAVICEAVRDRRGVNDDGNGWIQRARPHDCAAAIRAGHESTT